MTSFVRFAGLKAITICAGLSMTAGLALAADNNVTKDEILGALYVKPQPLTRGLSVGAPQVDPAVKAKEANFLASVRNRRTRSLSLGEREEIAEIAATKPKIDLEIQFDYNSAAIGHTDAIGSDAFNQDLSERRADTIKRYLVDNYHIATGELVTVGYGKSKLKNAQNPTDPINRRVQVVNMDTKTAAQ